MPKMAYYSALIFLVMAESTFATNVSGYITGNISWTTNSSPYVVTAPLYVVQNARLTIDPGVEVQIYSGVSMTVSGSLYAVGADATRIRFTRYPGSTYGGTLRLSGGTGVFENCDFTLLGSGMMAASSSTLSMLRCVFTNLPGSVVSLTDSRVTFAQNIIRNTGEAIGATRCNGSIASNHISEIIGYADCIELGGNGSMSIIDNFVSGGADSTADGIDFNLVGTPTLVKGNTVMNFGDKGVSIGQYSYGIYINNLIYDCDVGMGVKDSSIAILANNTIVGCRYGVKEYAKYTQYGSVVLATNTIIWDCLTNVVLLNGSTFSASHCDICGTTAWPGTGNTTNDPLFMNAAYKDFRLRPGSPCINSGTNQSWMNSGTDLDGNPRLVNGTVDVGAYEFTPDQRKLKLYMPNGGESLDIGEVVPLSWSIYGTNWPPAATVKLQNSTNSGNSWSDIPGASNISVAPYNNYQSPWNTISLAPSEEARVRVVYEANPSVTDESDADFTLAYPSLDHFNWSAISSQKTANVPFPVMITAASAHNTTVTNFSDSANISGWIGYSKVTIGKDITSWGYPMSTENADSRTEVIYHSSEVGDSMIISSLSLDVILAPPIPMTNWTIRMRHTPLSSFSTSSWQTAGWTTVYRTNQSVTSTGWVTFVFTTPFNYNNASNLDVDFSINGSAAGDFSGFCRSSEATTLRSLHSQADGEYGDPLSWSGTSNPAPSTASSMPNICLSNNAARSVLITPEISGSFAQGIWTGFVTVSQIGTGVHLRAETTLEHAGDSGAFDTAPCYWLTVVSDHSGAVPPAGTNATERGAAYSCSLTNSPATDGTTQYVCIGWTGFGSVPATGNDTNTGVFSMTNDSSIVWLWRTNFYLDTTVAGSGAVDVADGWFQAGTNVLVTAMPAQYNHLTFWSGDTNGCAIATNKLTAPMTNARQVAANFAANLAPLGTPEWWLVSHGLTNEPFNIIETRDSDFDGALNWEEWIAGTDATNRGNVFRATTFLPQTNGRFSVTFSSISGKTYQVWGCVNLITNGWITLQYATNPIGVLGSNVLTARWNTATIYVATNANRYYRISVK